MELNERGFIYPLTIGIYLLFISFFLILVGLYINEKRVIKESTALLRQEYYFMSSLKDIETKLAYDIELTMSGSYSYSKATVYYLITPTPANQNVLKVDYTLIAEPNYQIYGISYYSKEEKRMTKWVEMK